jgi:hypothetical protein
MEKMQYLIIQLFVKIEDGKLLTSTVMTRVWGEDEGDAVKVFEKAWVPEQDLDGYVCAEVSCCPLHEIPLLGA